MYRCFTSQQFKYKYFDIESFLHRDGNFDAIFYIQIAFHAEYFCEKN